MPVVVVERRKSDSGDRHRSHSDAFTQSFQSRPPFFSWCWVTRLSPPSWTLSLPRVTNIKFLLQPHQKYYITQYEELGFHCLLRWKMIILPILTTSLIYFPSNGWENVLFELGSERVMAGTVGDDLRCTVETGGRRGELPFSILRGSRPWLLPSLFLWKLFSPLETE